MNYRSVIEYIYFLSKTGAAGFACKLVHSLMTADVIPAVAAFPIWALSFAIMLQSAFQTLRIADSANYSRETQWIQP